MNIGYKILLIGFASVSLVSAGAFSIPQPSSAEGLNCLFSQIGGDFDGDGTYDAVLVYGDSISARVLQVYSLGKAKDLQVSSLSIKTGATSKKDGYFIDFKNLISWKDLDSDGAVELIVGNKLYSFYTGFSRPWKQ